MDSEIKLLLYFFVSFFLSLFSVPFLLKISVSSNFLDGPKTQKRISDKKVPNLGGVSIFIFFWLFYFLLMYSENFHLFFFLSSLIFCIGIYDDYYDIRPLFKFSLPFIATLLAIFFLKVQISIFDNSVFNILFTFLWIYGLTNSLNFLDNMDGVSPGFLTINTFFLFYFSFINNLDLASSFLVLFGLNLGFLFYNFPPAKIYLGDNGSLTQGFILSILMIEMDWNFDGINIKLFAPVFLMGYPILDTTYVVLSRTLNNRRPWIGDTNHTSHKLLKMGYSNRLSVLIIYIITIIFCLSGVLIYTLNEFFGSLIFFANVLLIMFFLYKLNSIKFEKC